MAFNYSPKISTNGLVLYFDAANPRSYVSGSTIWNDISRQGNNGTLTNGPTYSSTNGGSIVFDGTNDLVNVTNNLSGRQKWSSYWANSNKLSITTFLKPKNLVNTGGRAGIIGNRYYYDTGYFNFHFHNGFDLAYNNGYNANFTTMFNMTAYSNTNVFLALTHNGDLTTNCIRYCINGTFYNASLGSAVPIGTFMSGTGFNVVIGAEQTPLQMDMYNVTMYNRLLSDAEVLQNYNATRTRFGL